MIKRSEGNKWVNQEIKKNTIRALDKQKAGGE